MYKFIIGFALLSPFIGVLFMEAGTFSLTSYEIGYPNGAKEMYLLYILVFLLGYYIFKKTSFQKYIQNNTLYTKGFSIKGYQNAFFVSVGIFLVTLFVFGSINVILGNVHKGEFRIRLGFFGFIAMGLSRWLSPTLLAYTVTQYIFDQHKSSTKKRYIIGQLLFTSLMAASWGFKSFAITILIPAGIIYYWRIPIYKLLLITCLALVSFIGFSIFFDNNASTDLEFLDGQNDIFHNLSGDNAILAVLYRLTVLQGDVCWIMWERYTSGIVFPPFAPTILASLGNKISSIFMDDNAMRYSDFSSILTAVASNGDVIDFKGEYNVTGTVFSEGILAGGTIGIIFFGFLAGGVTGFVIKSIQRHLTQRNSLKVALYANYFYLVFGWINGGGVVILFHFATILSIWSTYYFIRIFIEPAFRNA